MNREDQSSVKFLVKRKRKNPAYRFFVASKRGGNAKGKGENRSVILSSDDGKNWHQSIKVWGENNEKRASEIVMKANSILLTNTT